MPQLYRDADTPHAHYPPSHSSRSTSSLPDASPASSPHLALDTHSGSDSDDDDELLQAERILARTAPTAAHFSSSSAYPHGRSLKPRWWARTTTWMLVSALLFLALLVVGGGAAHPAVREYVGERVDKVTGLAAVGGTSADEGGGGGRREAGGEWWDEEEFWADVRAGRKANATLTILVSPRSNLFKDLLPTLTNLEARFNGRFGYPVQLLTDGELPDEGMRERTRWVTRGKARWGAPLPLPSLPSFLPSCPPGLTSLRPKALVNASTGWGPPPYVSSDDIAAGKEGQLAGFPIGYRNMCRFFSRFHHNHPSLAGFEYIWRMDEGVEFFCEIQDDPFLTMKATNSLYGYTNTDTEALFTIPTLWAHVRQFMDRALLEHPSWFPQDRDESVVRRPRPRESEEGEEEGEEEGGLEDEYTRFVYYNNFEIVHRSFLESEPYQAFVDYLDRAKGFYTERWGDAPIRTIALSFFASPSRIHNFENQTAYRHDNVPFACPDQPYCYCNPAKSKDNAFKEWYRA
ncbi:hypothetical protein JCM8097_001154 [Rhodosporidiobolus ruineniae]